MPLTTYDEARHWGPQIRDEVLGRRMPPWPAADGFGDFVNTRSLSPVEMELLAAWTGGGMPKGGDQTVLPHNTNPADGELLTITRGADDQSSTVQLRSPVHPGEEKWIAAWRLSPVGADRTLRAVVRINQRLLGTWVPAEGLVRFPRGVAMPFTSDDQIAVEFEQGKTQNPRADAWTLALEFGPAGAVPEFMTFGCGDHQLPETVDLIEIMPRAAAAGDPVTGVAQMPDGTELPLFAVPSFDPADQPSLRLRTPARLPAGTTIQLRSAGDCAAGLLFTSRKSGPAARRGR